MCAGGWRAIKASRQRRFDPYNARSVSREVQRALELRRGGSVLCPLLDTGPAPCKPNPVRPLPLRGGSFQPSLLRVKRVNLQRVNPPSREERVGWLRTCVPKCRCCERRPKRRFVCLEGADVQGRTSGALLTPEVMQLLTSLRSGAKRMEGSCAGEGGAARWAQIELHNGRGGRCPRSSFQPGSS